MLGVWLHLSVSGWWDWEVSRVIALLHELAVQVPHRQGIKPTGGSAAHGGALEGAPAVGRGSGPAPSVQRQVGWGRGGHQFRWQWDRTGQCQREAVAEQVSARERLRQNMLVPERGWEKTGQRQREAVAEQVSARERLRQNRSVPERGWENRSAPERGWDRTVQCQREAETEQVSARERLWQNRLKRN